MAWWVAILSFVLVGPVSAEDRSIRILYLGDDGHHQPLRRAEQLIPYLASRGIDVSVSTKIESLRGENLAAFDALVIYANTETLPKDLEDSLSAYVVRGGGLVAIHCASFCFQNSDGYVSLIGAQFDRHGFDRVATVLAEPDHPLMKGFQGFESLDETYIHRRHNETGRTVLEYRVGGNQAPGQDREPWTWVRTEGKGRVFYTAWGHDERTWGHPGFQNLVERGIRWASGDDPERAGLYHDPHRFEVPAMTELRRDVAPFEYVDVGAQIPTYPANQVWGTQSAPATRMQKPLSPEESSKHWVTPAGFSMKLFATEKDLGGKPIAMTWDEAGRTWVGETLDYPNELRPPGQGRDRIRVLEDIDGDGSADRSTVFAENLSIPTAIVPWRGGVIVQDGTETVYLKDRDGDGQADQRSVLITGWAMGDTHGGVSNFRYGHDNWIWAMQGYNPSKPVADGKTYQSFTMGFFRFKLDASDPPRVTDIEFLRSTYGNSWGLGLSEEGLVFGSSANGHPSLFLTFPNRYLERVRGWTPSLQADSIADSPAFKPVTANVRQVDHHGNYSAAAGHALYTARVYPRTWWNRTAFVCGPEGHLVGTFVLKPIGSTYRSTSPCNLVASDDEWSAPILAEVGPDGNVWIIDWYNYIVQHNPTPIGFETGKGNAYETNLRDKSHGRIYRLTFRGTESSPMPRLDRDDPKTLLAALSHSNMFWRLAGQRLLIERGDKDVSAALAEQVRDRSVDEIGVNGGAQHALATLHGLGLIGAGDAAVDEAARSGLDHPAMGVRRAALTFLPKSESLLTHAKFRAALSDPESQVVLAALLGIADAPPSSQAAADLVRIPPTFWARRDKGLEEAFISAASAHAYEFLNNALAQSNDTGSVLPATVMAIVAEHHARGKIEVQAFDDLMHASRRAPSDMVSAVLTGLARGWPRDHRITISPASEELLIGHLAQLTPLSRGLVLQIADTIGSKRLREEAKNLTKTLAHRVSDASLEEVERIRSALVLVDLARGREETVRAILSAMTTQASPELVEGLAGALRESTSPRLGPMLLDSLAKWTPAARRVGMGVLLSRAATANALMDGIEEGRVAWDELSLDQRQALVSFPEAAVAERAGRLLSAGGGLPDPDRDKVLQTLMPLTKQRGDVARGKEVFHRNCSKCHRHGSLGDNIGPDLTGMAVHPKAEMLLNIIDPSRSVEANYRAYTVATVDGRVRTGLLAAESKTVVELIDAEAKRFSIAREDIEEIAASRKSLMPEGFEKQMSEPEIVDLLEFLAARGKFTPLDLRRAATTITTRGMFTSESADVERLIFPDWKPKTFEGVPFLLIDPAGDRIPNAIMLHGDLGEFPPRMPRSVRLAVGQPARWLHFLGGVSGWGSPAHADESVSVTVRIIYAGGATEDHELKNGVHFADYIRVVDVPASKLAFRLRGQQIRYFALEPKSAESIDAIELFKGEDPTAPIFMSITAEAR